MESSIQKIKEIYQKKVSLFGELLHYVDQERENLMDLNTHNLLVLFQEKQKIIQSIEDMNQPIDELIQQNDIPMNDKQMIVKLQRRISHLKAEIKTRTQENISFIQESLDFFQDIISIFSNAGRPEHLYHPNPNNRKQMSSLIYHNEV